MFFDEFFFNMERVFKVEEPYGGDKRMEHPNPKRPEFKSFHQILATVLTIKEGMTVLQQVEKEIARVIDLFMSDGFQEMYLDMCGMLMTEKMVDLSKTHKGVKTSKLKNNLWVNLIAGLTHPQISVKKYLKHGLNKTGAQLMLPKILPKNKPLLAESLWDPKILAFSQESP